MWQQQSSSYLTCVQLTNISFRLTYDLVDLVPFTHCAASYFLTYMYKNFVDVECLPTRQEIAMKYVFSILFTIGTFSSGERKSEQLSAVKPVSNKSNVTKIFPNELLSK